MLTKLGRELGSGGTGEGEVADEAGREGFGELGAIQLLIVVARLSSR